MVVKTKDTSVEFVIILARGI